MDNNQLSIHVAVIPDGNRRWARSRGFDPWKGHEAGASNFEALIKYSLKRGIACLSIWGSSLDNLTKRPMQEKKALLDIYQRYFNRLLQGSEIHEHEVQVNIIGRWEEQFPEALKKTIYEIIEKTKNYRKRMLNFLLAYSGTDEMIFAIQNILDNSEKETKITPETVKSNLMTRNIPAVDLLIRTGGEPHNSTGFMMWDVADSQFFFSTLNFPDFSEIEYEKALSDFENRQRRFGK